MGTGQLEKVVDAYYEEPELVTEREKLQHFIYRPDGTISAFDVNVTTVNELQYADGFLPGEKIFTEKWSYRPGSMALRSRRVKDGFSPVLMQTYIEGLPPVTFVTYIDMFPDLFMYKYVYTKEYPGMEIPSRPQRSSRTSVIVVMKTASSKNSFIRKILIRIIGSISVSSINCKQSL
ncbi:MAG: hypothetical protein V8S95_12375 [Odoribacter sp.]